MSYRVLAHLVALTHLAFVLYVVLGGLLVRRWPGSAWLHVPAVIWGAALELFGWVCPLTPLEVALNRRGGGVGYDDGFLEHYLLPLLYPDGLTRSTQLLLGAAVLGINLLIYAHLWRTRRPRRDGLSRTGGGR